MRPDIEGSNAWTNRHNPRLTRRSALTSIVGLGTTTAFASSVLGGGEETETVVIARDEEANPVRTREVPVEEYEWNHVHVPAAKEPAAKERLEEVAKTNPAIRSTAITITGDVKINGKKALQLAVRVDSAANSDVNSEAEGTVLDRDAASRVPESVEDVPIDIQAHKRTKKQDCDDIWDTEFNNVRGGAIAEGDSTGTFGYEVLDLDDAELTGGILMAGHVVGDANNDLEGRTITHNGSLVGEVTAWNNEGDWAVVESVSDSEIGSSGGMRWYDTFPENPSDYEWRDSTFDGWLDEEGLLQVLFDHENSTGDSSEVIKTGIRTESFARGDITEAHITAGEDSFSITNHGVEFRQGHRTIGKGDSGGPVAIRFDDGELHCLGHVCWGTVEDDDYCTGNPWNPLDDGVKYFERGVAVPTYYMYKEHRLVPSLRF